MFKRMSSRILQHPYSHYIIVFVFLITSLSLLLIPASLSQPIADDFFYFYNDDSKSIIETVKNHYMTINGRWAQILSVSLSYEVFGIHATQVIPVVEILLLVIITTCLTYLLLPVATKRRTIGALMIGPLVVVTALYLLPSIFDSLFWLTSSTVYVFALIAMIIIATSYILLSRLTHLKLWHIVSFALFVIVSQAFNETAAAMCLLTFMGIYALLILKVVTIGTHAKIMALTGFISSLIGLTIVFFAPGTAQRRSHSHTAVDIQSLLISPLENFKYLAEITTSWKVLFILALGMVIALVMPKLNRRAKIQIAIIGLSLSLLPIYFNGVVTHYGVGGTPLRAYTIPIFLTVIGLSLLMALAVQQIKSISDPLFKYLSLPILALLLVGSMIVASATAAPLIQAQTLRKSLTEYRATTIERQVTSKVDEVHVIPAPNLLVSSEAVDLAYNTNQTDWFIEYFKKYYKFSNKKMIIETQQPQGYCLSDQAPSWFGAYICKDLPHVDTSSKS